MLGNEKIYQVGSFTYLGSIVSKDGVCNEDVNCRIRPGIFFHSWRKFLRIWI